MSNCKNCSNVDVFPLVKNCKTGTCPTGPTGPRGPRGRNGPAFSNYLYLKGTFQSSGDPPTCGDLTLIDKTTTAVLWCTAPANSGNWDFSEGQSSFIVPEDGVYRITFDPSLQYNKSGIVNYSYKMDSTITIDSTPVNEAHINRNIDYTFNFNDGVEMLHNEIVVPLTAGQSIEFTVKIDASTLNLNNFLVRFASTSATIQRFA